MAFVKGQSGNPRNKEFADKLISLYIKGDPICQIISELGITKRAFKHYLYGETAWFNSLSNHDYQDVKKKRAESELLNISAKEDFLKTRDEKRKLYYSLSPNRFYVYTHTDVNNVVFYVGKGTKDRAYSTNRNKAWKDRAKVGYTTEIIYDGLTEQEAIEKEDSLICNPPELWDLVNVQRSDTKLDYSKVNWEELFYYDETSPTCLRYKVDNNGVNSGKRFANDVAGYINTSDNYSRYKVGYLGKEYMVHRIIYQMLRGDIRSDMVINHINTNSQDNRICNLEQVTSADNNRKQKHHVIDHVTRNNSSGVNCFRFTETDHCNLTCHIFIRDVLGNTITKKISCLKYGKDEAKAVALKYIKEMKMLIQQELFYLRGEKCHL